MVSATQSVEVKGDHTQVVTVGKDLVFAQTYVQQVSQFYKPNLDQYRPPRFPLVRTIADLTQTLHQQRLLVLGGSLEVNQKAVARQIAWYLQSKLQMDAGPEEPEVPVSEWDRGSDQQSLVVTLRERDAPEIFILPDVSPQNVGYDLQRLQQTAIAGEHYVIVSTDTPYTKWRFPDDRAAKLFWRKLDPSEIHNSDDLSEILIQKLITAQSFLPESLHRDGFEPDSTIAGDVTVRKAAEGLRTPTNIALFVQLLCDQKEPVTEEDVRENISLAENDQRILTKWFHTLLNSREQSLALGLAFFEGLFDDQFFTALDQVLGQAWRPRDPLMIYPDYHDLDNITAFYNFAEAETRGVKLESRLPEQRFKLFETVWQSHRRHILAALPTLVDITRKSVAGRELNLALYGTHEMRVQLRTAIGEALSDIGLISFDSVENALIQLAADIELGVQAVVARALARWREYGRDEVLFEVLGRWRREARLVDLIEVIIKGQDEETKQSPQALIRATIALTASYAATYDPPNQLSRELVDLLVQLSRDQNRLVRNRFSTHTLPQVVPLHLHQLREVLRQMVRYIDLLPTIGSSLALAYRTDPDEVIALLDDWHEECRASRPRSFKKDVIEFRDALVATTALTYGYIRYGEGIGPLSADDAFHRMQHILEQEQHPFIRSAVVIAISLQAERYFEKVEPQLYEFVAEVSKHERDEIVKILKKVYLKQRRDLDGGDEVIEVDDARYWIWKSHQKRPLTAVEEAMFRWIKGENNTVAQQIATQASVEFAKALDLAEAEELQRLQKEEKERLEAETSAQDETLRELDVRRAIRHSSLIGSVATWLATVRAAEYRQVIGGLLPEALAQKRAERSAMVFVLGKWQHAQDTRVKHIANMLKRAISLTENALVYLVVIAFILTVVGCSCLCTLSATIR